MTMTYFKSICFKLVGVLFFISLSGCSHLAYKATGNAITQYSKTEAVPYLFATNDVDMACSLSEAFSPLIFSFERFTSSPEKMKILLYMMAGSCAETRSWDPELRYLRALKRNDPIETLDARIEQKRFLLQAAQRNFLSYSALVKTMGNGEQCPRFASSQDELLWLVGLLSGLQSSFADIASEHKADVPLDTSQKVARAAGCLDSAKWWGVPLAIQSAVAASIPSSPEETQAALKQLAKASAMGMAQRVRLASVLEAQIYFSKGQTDQVKRVIREYAQAKQEIPADPAMKLLDEVAAQQLQAISDRLWTEAKGTRTPFNGLGSFWDDAVPAQDESQSTLLDNL